MDVKEDFKEVLFWMDLIKLLIKGFKLTFSNTETEKLIIKTLIYL